MSQYLFDNAGPHTAQRFESLAALYDPITVRHLLALGATDGWHCLEIGGGGGSIAGWLAARVGASGHVLVTDIDPRYLATLAARGLPNLEVRRHDIARDPLPSSAYDLIHVRLVLNLLPTAEEVLGKLVAALKPGGWLLIEDFDHHFIDRTFPTADRVAAAAFQRMADAQAELLARHGGMPGWSRGQYQRLRTVGLQDVTMEGQAQVWPGGSAGARLLQANYEQVRAEAVAQGLVADEDVAVVLDLLDDPDFAVSSMMLFSAWGRRPAQ